MSNCKYWSSKLFTDSYLALDQLLNARIEVFQIAQPLAKPKTLTHSLSVDLMTKNINDWAKIDKNNIAAAML